MVLDMARAQKKSGKRLTKWDRKEFIALDGEGENSGPEEQLCIGDKIYKSRDHLYTLLSAWGRGGVTSSLYNAGKRLDTYDCIDWLLDLGGEYPKAIFVIFAGGYDVNHMLRGFERGLMEEIAAGEILEFEHGGERYQIQYRPRKSLSLKRGFEWKLNQKTGESKPHWRESIIVWDVFGFFQENFVGVMGKWLGKTHRHFELIKRMKAQRGNFENLSHAEINAYNIAELETLVELMEKVHEGIDGLDLKCMRFDGAGAVASAMYRKHGIRQFKSEPPEEVLTAARTAYAGGRIEICKIGTMRDTVFDYDINSAYPDTLRKLPSLAHGFWEHLDGKAEPGFTLVHCKYKFEAGLPFYPLFYRSEKMQIIFGQEGEGWYWWPEFEAAQKFPGRIEILESYVFREVDGIRPFTWIDEYYEKRRQWVSSPTEEWQRGGEKIIKLGLNSLYGKTAQQVGGADGKAPSYHQIEWAGYITSATRARLLEAAILNPSAIIGFATDGIFSTEKLDLKISTDKSLGEWSLTIFEGLTVVMAGVYWWHNADGTFGHFSRGFDKDAMKTPQPIWDAWAGGRDSIDVPMYRLIGMSSACISESFWPWRGRFVESMRSLALDGHSHKRNGMVIKKTRPHLGLVDLDVAPNIEYGFGLQGCSYAYPLKWLEPREGDDFSNELEMGKELSDSENI